LFFSPLPSPAKSGRAAQDAGEAMLPRLLREKKFELERLTALRRKRRTKKKKKKDKEQMQVQKMSQVHESP
jgi:hypothetical protein